MLRQSIVQIATSNSVNFGPSLEPAQIDGIGTGVVLDTEGHILTNEHVVAGARTLIVTLHSGESYNAVIVGGDLWTDAAVVKIDPSNLDLKPAKFGRSRDLAIGEDVLAVGHSLQYPGPPIITDGIISTKGVSLDLDFQFTVVDVILHTAALNPGNSGGPLLNMRGEVVGLNMGVSTETIGLGYAVNIDDARMVAERLIRFEGVVRRSSLGIRPINVTPEFIVQASLNVPQSVRSGVLVAEVHTGSPAEAAGINQGDVIFRIDQTPIDNTGQLARFLFERERGEEIEVNYYRGGLQHFTVATLGEPTQ